MPRYPRPLDRLPYPVAESILGMDGDDGAVVLGVKPTAGGRKLYDPGTSAEYATDADGFYVDSAGNRLTVDAGYSAGDEVGLPAVYGLPGATVFGAPATGRRSGFDTFSDADYIRFTPTATATDFSAFVAGNRPGDFDTLLASSAGAGPDRVVFRSGVGNSSTVIMEVLAVESGLFDKAEANSLRAVGLPVQAAWGYSVTGEKDAAAWWNETKRDADQEGDATINPDVSGEEWYFGRNNTAGQTWGSSGTADVVLFWESYQDHTAHDAMWAAWTADPDVDGLVSSLGATWGSDGLICGAIDLSDPTALAYIGAEGDGTPVVVAEAP